MTLWYSKLSLAAVVGFYYTSARLVEGYRAFDAKSANVLKQRANVNFFFRRGSAYKTLIETYIMLKTI